MANFNLVINSKYTPFNFEELLKPVVMATEAYNQTDEAYSKLMEQAELWGNKANQQTDPVAYAQYKNYADRLASYADALANRGLSMADRQGLREMRKEYAKDIIPIQEAYTKRMQDIKAQQQILMQDPTHIFGKYAAQTSLDEYLKNSNLDVLSQNYSGTLMMQQVGTMAANVAKEAREAIVDKTSNKYYLKFIQRYGYKPEEVLAAISNPDDPKANSVLTGILNQAMDASGVADWASEADFNKMRNYAGMGLWNAIGQDNVSFNQDIGAVEGLRASFQLNHDLTMLREKAKMEKESQVKIPLDSKTGIKYNVSTGMFEKEDGTPLTASPYSGSEFTTVYDKNGKGFQVRDPRGVGIDAYSKMLGHTDKNSFNIDSMTPKDVISTMADLLGGHTGSKDDKIKPVKWVDAHRSSLKGEKGNYEVFDSDKDSWKPLEGYFGHHINSPKGGSYNKWDGTYRSFHHGDNKPVKGGSQMYVNATAKWYKENQPGLVEVLGGDFYNWVSTEGVKYVRFYGNENVFDRNHYWVTGDGVAPDGTIQNSYAYAKSLKAMRNSVINYEQSKNIR